MQIGLRLIDISKCLYSGHKMFRPPPSHKPINVLSTREITSFFARTSIKTNQLKIFVEGEVAWVFKKLRDDQISVQLGQLIMYYTPKKVLPFAFFLTCQASKNREEIVSQTNLAEWFKFWHLWVETNKNMDDL